MASENILGNCSPPQSSHSQVAYNILEAFWDLQLKVASQIECFH